MYQSEILSFAVIATRYVNKNNALRNARVMTNEICNPQGQLYREFCTSHDHLLLSVGISEDDPIYSLPNWSIIPPLYP
jgi:hypothetical protein